MLFDYWISLTIKYVQLTLTLNMSKGVEPAWPNIALNLKSAEIVGYNSTHKDIEVNFPSSCNESNNAWNQKETFFGTKFSKSLDKLKLNKWKGTSTHKQSSG